MLDELDALMERMLALPVNDPENLPPSAKAPEAPTLSATLTVVEPPATREEAPAPPAGPVKGRPEAGKKREPGGARQPAPRAYTFPPIEGDGAPETREQPAPVQKPSYNLPPAPTLDEILPPLTVHRPAPAPVIPARPRNKRSLTGLCLQSLVWANSTFDQGTLWMGGVGRWLLGGQGRKVLGLAGLGMLTLAGGWLLLDALGWTR